MTARRQRRRWLRLQRVLPVLAATAIVAGCGRGEAPAPAMPAATPPSPMLIAERVPATRERIWDGVVEAVHQATLSAQTGGRVVELPFDVNDVVAAGDVVVRFTDVEQQAALRRAEAALDGAEAAWREAEAEHARVAEVHARQLVARAVLDRATARRDAARAALDGARAALREAAQQLGYTVIRAPYSGILTERHVQVGETVRPGQALVSGLSLARLRVQVQVPQGDVAAIRSHGRAAVLLADGRRVDAERVTVFPYADPATHSFQVRLDLPEAETGLHPGMAVKAAFVLGEAERVLVPVTALVRRAEITGVYVSVPQGLVLRQLRLGHRNGDSVEVLAGLEPGERYAADPVAAAAWLAGRGRD